ncbi:hypothetical protein [Catellatospora tritici]|uniref:hypothetical protein n=1 Tax=Catellatospora tritici TaxID=2851566 RepID=UPI001C2D6793|nr:hypothetical protein [Catellatospora tritici]MBV1854442.1 hypothetical protein [Catellatospora tritici]
MRLRQLTVGLLPLLMLTTVACGTSDDGVGVASVSGAGAPSATPSVSRQSQLVRYAQCMREQGVPMADPQVEGDVVREPRIEQGFDKGKADAAAQVCQQYRPPRLTGPEVEAKTELVRQLARCMREQGVETYPDPDAEGRTRIDEATGSDPQFAQAKQVCDARIAAMLASLRPGS